MEKRIDDRPAVIQQAVTINKMANCESALKWGANTTAICAAVLSAPRFYWMSPNHFKITQSFTCYLIAPKALHVGPSPTEQITTPDVSPWCCLPQLLLLPTLPRSLSHTTGIRHTRLRRCSTTASPSITLSGKHWQSIHSRARAAAFHSPPSAARIAPAAAAARNGHRRNPRAYRGTVSYVPKTAHHAARAAVLVPESVASARAVSCRPRTRPLVAHTPSHTQVVPETGNQMSNIFPIHVPNTRPTFPSLQLQIAPLHSASVAN